MRSPVAAVFLALVLAITASAALAFEASSGSKDPARQITSQLICPCSCGEILSGCTCDTGKSMQGFVSDALKKGQSKDQITASLVAKYGEVIRGAPKAQGFNLIVWIAPFAATLVGFAIAGIILLRWVRRRAPVPVVPIGAAPGRWGAATTAEQDMDALRARAEAELKRYRE